MSQMMFNSGAMQYEMYNYDTSSTNYYPGHSNKIPVEYTGSSALDDRDRRRRRSGSTPAGSKDKDSLTNMHLVCQFPLTTQSGFTDSVFSDGARRTEPRSVLSGNAKKSM